MILPLRTAAREAVRLPRPPGGTMEPDSVYYIERAADKRALALAGQSVGVTCAIMAPRQFGKSSLLERAAKHAEAAGKQVVRIDFQSFDTATLADLTVFFKTFVGVVVKRLGLDVEIEAFWKGPKSGKQLCTDFFVKHIFPACPNLFLAMDETDRLLETNFGGDFFSMLRFWHNERSRHNASLDLFLVSATEPSLLVRNPHESPFNVGEALYPNDLTREEAGQLNLRYGAPLNTRLEGQFYDLLGGHPYLTHVAAYFVAADMPPEQMLEEKKWDRSPFGDHLRNFAYRILDDPGLKKAFKQALAGRACDYMPFTVLRSMGLLAGTAQKPTIRRELYRRYYAKQL